MSRLEDLLPPEYRTPEAQLFAALAWEDQKLLGNLIEIRKSRGLSQQDMADAMGVTQATVSAFERLGNDPRLSTVRRYAKALGVLVAHEITESPALEQTSRVEAQSDS
jgi:transcriptional regulator with XRE-family HTH domain